MPACRAQLNPKTPAEHLLHAPDGSASPPTCCAMWAAHNSTRRCVFTRGFGSRSSAPATMMSRPPLLGCSDRKYPTTAAFSYTTLQLQAGSQQRRRVWLQIPAGSQLLR